MWPQEDQAHKGLLLEGDVRLRGQAALRARPSSHGPSTQSCSSKSQLSLLFLISGDCEEVGVLSEVGMLLLHDSLAYPG